MSSSRTQPSDEAKIQEDLVLIKQVCADVDLDLISLIFHECEYDIDQTIMRIHAGDFQDSGWQTAKTNHRKKPSPPPRPIRSNPPFRRPIPSKVDVAEPASLPSPPPPPAPASVEPDDENVSSASSNVERKQRLPPKPVSVYRALQLPSFPSDIRFGDIQWNDDGPFAVTPTDFITEQQLTSSTDFISPFSSTTNPTENVESSERLPIAAAIPPVEPLISTLANDPSELHPNYLPTSEANSPPFVPFNSTANNYPSNSNDYPTGTSATWSNPTTTAYKPTPKTPTNYSPQTPVFHLGNYSYSANSPVVPIVMSFDTWQNNGYPQTMDNYSYAPANYLSANYSNQPHYYSQQKYDPTNTEHNFFANYGHTTATHQDPSANSAASGKDGPMKSRLSATAAAFPSPYSVQAYPPYQHGQTHYPSMDTRDHRQSGSYGNSNAAHRSNYYPHRSYPNNSNNWHSQQ